MTGDMNYRIYYSRRWNRTCRNSGSRTLVSYCGEWRFLAGNVVWYSRVKAVAVAVAVEQVSLRVSPVSSRQLSFNHCCTTMYNRPLWCAIAMTGSTL